MEKRLLLAIGLSLVVLLSWSAIASKTQPTVSTIVTSNSVTKAESSLPAKESSVSRLLPVEESKLPLLQINHKNSEIYFDEKHAAINKVIFKLERDATFPLKFGFLTDDNNLKYSKVNSGPDEVSFVAQDGQKKITKSFIFTKSNYAIDLQIKVQNISSSPIALGTSLILGVLDSSRSNVEGRYEDVYVSTLSLIHI